MVDSSDFFAQPAFGLCQIYYQVFSIFRAEWGTFIILSVLQIAALIPIVAIFLIAAVASFSTQMMMILPLLQNGLGGNRLLIGAHLHRLLDQSGGSNNEDFTFDDAVLSGDQGFDPMMSGVLISSVVAFLIVWTIASVCVSATFSGAMIRAVAEIFAGQTPNWLVCIKAGWTKMCKLVGFSFIIAVIPYIAFFTCMGILVASNAPSSGFVLMMVVFSIAFLVVSSTMIAGPSSIVIEGRSSIEAVKGSWNLCKGHICFIFCSIFCFNLLEFIVTSILQRIILGGGDQSTTQTSIFFLLSLLLHIVTVPLNLIVCPVIYFSLRIRNGLTQVDLVQELSDVLSIELASDAKYQHASNAADDDEDYEKAPIAVAHAV